MGEATVWRLVSRYQKAGEIKPKTPPGRNKTLLEKHELLLKKWLAEKNDLTLEELRQRLFQSEKIAVSIVTIYHACQRLKMPYKKTLFPAEQQRPDVQQARADFKEYFLEMSINKLIFLDESGVHLARTRAYGRGLSHERVVSYAPCNKGTRVTMIAAIGAEEVKAATFGDWHVDGDIFLDFISRCLVPVLEPGNLVFLDNLKAHKVGGIREAIESVGAKLIYLLPYSPDLNPIELCWSKIKSYLRKKTARTFEHLKQVISEAFHEITPTDLQAWFEHCGYCNQ